MIHFDRSTEVIRSRSRSHSSNESSLNDQQQHRLVTLLDNYLVELEKGNRPSREQLIADNPDLAADLIEAIESIDLLHRFDLPTNSAIEKLAPSRGSSWEKPTQIGPYEIGEELGRGAMGVVYAARLRATQSEVAIKVLLGTWSREKQRIERFQREARAAESLNHPNIIPVYDIGFEDGHHFYTMKRIEGLSLAQIIYNRESDLSKPDIAYRELATKFAHIADSLHAAHISGIVHRDVKPSNLLIDTQDQIWITDFGLAQIDDGASLTRSGDLVGTFQYMSPEQASGRPETVDRRTDIYSLGVTMYETFTGRQPFYGLEAGHLIQAIRTSEPSRPRAYNPTIPVELETIIQRAMRPDKSDRYSAALELAEDLNRFATGKKIRAARVTMAERMTRWSANHAGLVTASLFVAIVCVAALSFHNLIIQQEKARTFAELTRGNANYRQARQAVDTLGLQVADRLMAVPGTESIRQEVLAETLSYYESFVAASNADPRLTADVAQTRLKIARLIQLAGNTTDAINAYDNALGSLRTAWVKQPDQTVLITLIECLNELAVLCSQQGDSEQATQSLSEAQSLLSRLTDSTERKMTDALVHNSRAVIAVDKNDSMLAVNEARKAIEILTSLSDVSPSTTNTDIHQVRPDMLHQDMADALGNLSVMLSKAGNDSEAAIVAEQSLKMRREANRSNASPDQLRRLALSYNNLAALDWRSGRVTTAIHAYRASVELLEKCVQKAPGQLGPRRELAVTLNNLGMALSSVPNHREAENAFRRAIAIAGPVADSDPNNAEASKRAAGIWNNLGVLLQELKDFKSADIAYRNAIGYQKTVCKIVPTNDAERLSLNQFEKNLQTMLSVPENRSGARDKKS